MHKRITVLPLTGVNYRCPVYQYGFFVKSLFLKRWKIFRKSKTFWRKVKQCIQGIHRKTADVNAGGFMKCWTVRLPGSSGWDVRCTGFPVGKNKEDRSYVFPVTSLSSGRLTMFIWGWNSWKRKIKVINQQILQIHMIWLLKLKKENR